MARTRPSHLSAGWHWDTVFSLRMRQGSDATGGRLSSSWRSITGHHPWRAQRSVTCATMEKRRCGHPELTELWQEAAPRWLQSPPELCPETTLVCMCVLSDTRVLFLWRHEEQGNVRGPRVGGHVGPRESAVQVGIGLISRQTQRRCPQSRA